MSKKKSYREIYIPVPVWDVEVVIIDGGSIKDVRAWASENLKDERKAVVLEHIDSYFAKATVRGHMIQVDGGGVLIWLPKWNVATLAHELVHAVHHILKEKGITLSDQTDEVYAYLYEYLFKSANPNIKT